MNLIRLGLKNYRRFPSFEIDFDAGLTVIAARNAQGKTTILEAAAAALGPFVGAFDEGKSRHIERSDARYHRVGEGYENEQNFPVVIRAELSNPKLHWQRALTGPKSRTTIKDATPLAALGQSLQASLRRTPDTTLPVLRYYSSRRLWVSHKNTLNKTPLLTQSRSIGYEDCLSPSSSFTQLQAWMRQATLALVQQRKLTSYNAASLEAQLKGIHQAVNTVMAQEGWEYFHYSLTFEELAMSHADHGMLPISLLSDGVRAMISLVADLALRCARLNVHLKEAAPTATAGIVLIDEVDLHLHPAWQQRVIASLQSAFPSVQFIVTTHSPQVLSTVKRESIRVVFQDGQGQWQAICPAQEVKGVESAVALSNVMGVNPIPPVDEAVWLADYLARIENGLHDNTAGRALRDKLIAFYGDRHPVLLDADRLIRFQDFKLRQRAARGD